MAITNMAVWEMRPTNGIDTSGGFFKEGASGTDYSQQNSPQYALSGLTSAGAGAIILTASASTDMVGNGLQVTSGTNFTTGIYEITSVSAGVSITVDRNCTTGVGATGVANVGGALKTFSKLIGAMASGSRAWVKAESTITSATNISVNFSSGLPCWISGYTTTRGDGGQVTIQAITNTGFNLISADNNSGLFQFILRNFILDLNSKTNVNGYVVNSNGCSGENIKVINLNGGKGFSFGNVQGGCFRNCLVLSPSGGTGFDFTGISNGLISAVDCQVLGGSSTTGFSMNGGLYLRCIAGNGTGTADAFHIASPQTFLHFQNCVAYKWGQDGFSFNNPSNNYTWTLMNCVSYGNGRYGVNNLNAGTISLRAYDAMNDYNFVGANSTADYNGFAVGVHSQTLTADPFTAGTSNDFSPNTTSGGGALLRAQGWPGALQSGGTGYIDGGALQHQDSGGGAATYVIAPRITRYIQESR